MSWIRSAADEKAVAVGCWFDEAAAVRVRDFFSKFLRHSKGEFAGKPFELDDWQWRSIIAPLFGWKRADGSRRYRRCSTWCGKKQGKSTLCSGLVLYGLVGDGEMGAEVYGAARDRSQAAIIYNECEAMVKQSAHLSRRLNIIPTTKRIVCAQTNSFYSVLSKDAHKSGHGINASVAIIDEVHVVDRELYNTLRYAMASRRQPLLIEISTAGNDTQSLGYERWKFAKQVLEGKALDPELLPVIYEADSNEVWEQEEQWFKANPGLGKTISLDSFRSDFNEAKQGSPATQANFKQLRLNLWQHTHHAWVALADWDACAGQIDRALLEMTPCWAGLDLASRLDICAFVVVFRVQSRGPKVQSQDHYYVKAWFWCPEEADSRRQQHNLALLKPWIEAGHIKATPGDTTDYDVVEHDIIEICDRLAVQEVRFDPWNATQITTHLQAHGITLREFGQTLRNYNEPMKECESLIREKRIVHDGNPVLRYMIGCTSVFKDSSGNVRPDKKSSKDKIDGVTALLMALAGPTQKENVEEPTITIF